MTNDFLEKNKYLNNEELLSKISTNLANRTRNNPNYSLVEISAITSKNSALCPSGFEISEKARETLRVLSIFSQCELRPARNITSHRKFIGPLIVFFKKLTWPLVRFHLKDTFESMQQFNSWTAYGLATQTIELEIIKKKISLNN